MIKKVSVLVSMILVTLLPFSPAAAETQSPDTSILIFGDSGYHHDYLQPSNYYRRARTRQQHQGFYLDRWLRQGKKVSDFRFPEAVYVPAIDGYVDASGLYPVAAGMLAYCELRRCDYGMMLGDNIYEHGATLGRDYRDDNARFEAMLTQPFSPLRRNGEDFRIYTALGNHDWGTSREGAELQLKFLEDDPMFYMDGYFYTVKPEGGNGDVELFVIDSQILLHSNTYYRVRLDENKFESLTDRTLRRQDFINAANDAERNMIKWLEKKLKASDARWKLVIAHHPFWSSSGEKNSENRAMRDIVRDLVCQYADAYFAGHDHTLEITADDCSNVDGVDKDRPPLMHVVSGAVAKQRGIDSLYVAALDKQYPFRKSIFTAGHVFGFTHMELQGDEATVRMITVPMRGPAEMQEVFTHTFRRRSGE